MQKASSCAFFKAAQNVDSISNLKPASFTREETVDGTITALVSQEVVIGTYVLESSGSGKNETISCAPRRKGSVLLVEAERAQSGDEDSTFHLRFREEIALPAVLDVQRSASSRTVYAACAESSLFAVKRGDDSQLLHCDRVPYACEDKADMILSVDVVDDESGKLVATSNSKGGIALDRITNGGSVERMFEKADGHSLEAWSVCIDRYSTQQVGERSTLYSGGDDGALCGWRDDVNDVLFRRRNAHGGVGVTTVATRSGHEYELWSGGYDDTIRIWDTRNMRGCVKELVVGGGVWRIKFHARDEEYALVAAMYEGCKAIRWVDGGDLQTVCGFDEHESIAYGVCWLEGLDWDGRLVAMSGSFYDCGVHVWNVDTRSMGTGQVGVGVGC